jgi:peptide/nickel transport system permease protein
MSDLLADTYNSVPAAPRTRQWRISKVNWPLWTGISLIFLVVVIAIWGPELAPHDPMAENYIVRYNDEWLSAPLAPFKVPDFPLGTDLIGRDTLSQLLWAVRPTLILVLLVAVIRLILGIILGLTAGWSNGRLGRFVDLFISAGLAIPVLIVALAIVAAIGIENGLGAFILGLVATGWAETARMVREQTRSVKAQPFIEAAKALGGSNYRLVFHNILRHVMPMGWMLFAFEISSTLLTTATLGFLGYYIGGEVWTPVSDTAAARSSGMPELGLMVATVSSDIFVGPWKMVAAGTVIFITILGFNLLGEGLRLRLNQPRRKTGRLSNTIDRLSMWVEEQVMLPGNTWLRGHAARPIVLGIILVGVIAGGTLWITQAANDAPAPAALPIPGNHIWAAERRDPYGTLHSSAAGMVKPKIEWKRNVPDVVAGGLAVSSAEIVYLTTRDGRLLAFQPDGSNVWVSPANIRGTPVGTPAISDQGRIYVVTEDGGLNALSPNGEKLWKFLPEKEMEGTGSPIVDPLGNVFYPRASLLEAVSPQGEELWVSNPRPVRTTQPAAITPDQGVMIMQDSLVNPSTGQKVNSEYLPKSEQFLVGGDGRLYGRSDQLIFEWQMNGDQAEIVREIEWDWQTYTFDKPRDIGVTAQGYIWLLFYSDREDAKLIWLDQSGVVLSQTRFTQRRTRMIGTDNQSTAHLCGSGLSGNAYCLAIQPGVDEPAWQLELPVGSQVTGGALLNGAMYVAVAEGQLYRISEELP